MQSGLLLKYRLVALCRGCVVHDFSIELYWLDVNVGSPSALCTFEREISFQVDWRAGGS